MIDREKVIKGLTCCSNHTPGFGCSECPYECDDMDQCIEAVTYDALELLKKQEPVKPHRNYQYLSDFWCDCGWHLGRAGSVKYCPDCGRKVDWE